MTYYRRGEVHGLMHSVAAIKKRLEDEELKTWQAANPSLRELWNGLGNMPRIGNSYIAFTTSMEVDTIHTDQSGIFKLDPPIHVRDGDWVAMDYIDRRITINRIGNHPVIYELDGDVYRSPSVPYSQ